MASPKQPRNITVVGGSGTIGKPIVESLLAENIHKISFITRPDSSAEFPAGATIHRGSYDDAAFLASALASQDVLIMAVSFTAYDVQIPLIKAAAEARVSYIVPAEFGSDATHGALNREIVLMNVKKPYRDLIESLGVSAWIGVTNNPWFDFCMRGGYFDVDLKARRAKLLDGGNVRANFSTLDRVGQTLAAVLSLPDSELSRYRNEWLYVSSFRVSQRDILESALRATGTSESDWTIEHGKAEDVRNWAREETAKGNHMAAARSLFALMFSEGFGGDYNDKVVDYKKLGLEQEESLDDVVKGLVAELKG